MPMGRMIQKSICQSRKLAKLKTDGARLLYTWLIPNLDINGCFSGDPLVIKGQIFTRLNHSLKTIESYLRDLENNELIIRYETNKDIFLIVPDFKEKQNKLNPEREAVPIIPTPTQEQLKSNSGVIPPQVKGSKGKQSKIKSSKTDGEKENLLDKRHPELQEIMDYAKQKGFSMQGSQQQNRRYAYNLMRKKDFEGNKLGVDRVKQLIDIAIAVRGEKYAPQVSDFIALFKKWQDLLAFVEKKKKGGRIG